MQLLFNNAISNSEFPENLKLADVTPVFKKKDPLDKTNYRPVSVLPSVSKIFERLMQKQINEHIKNKLSPYLCGYRKGFSTQYALLSLIERWKKILDEKGFGGAVLMDLSKAFDTLNHELLIAKLSACQNILRKMSIGSHRLKVLTPRVIPMKMIVIMKKPQMNKYYI